MYPEFTHLADDKIWTAEPGKGLKAPYGVDNTVELHLNANILIAGNASRYSLLHNVMAHAMEAAGPNRLRISIATDDADKFSCYSESPHLDFLATSESVTDTVRVIRRVAGIIQARATVYRRGKAAHVLVVDNISRLLTKESRSALTELAGIMYVGPRYDVYTIILTDSAKDMYEPFINLFDTKICAGLSAKDAKALIGRTLNPADATYVSQDKFYSAITTVPEFTSADMEKLCAEMVQRAADSGFKPHNKYIVRGETDA